MFRAESSNFELFKEKHISYFLFLSRLILILLISLFSFSYFFIQKFGWDWSLEESKLILCKLDIICGLGEESINLIPGLISVPFPASIFWLIL